MFGACYIEAKRESFVDISTICYHLQNYILLAKRRLILCIKLDTCGLPPSIALFLYVHKWRPNRPESFQIQPFCGLLRICFHVLHKNGHQILSLVQSSSSHVVFIAILRCGTIQVPLPFLLPPQSPIVHCKRDREKRLILHKKRVKERERERDSRVI